MAVPFLSALRTTVARHAARPAIAYAGRTYSYGELDAVVRRAAALLQCLKVEESDRIALCTSDKLAFLVAHLATLYIGGISLPLNPRYTRDEQRYFLSDSGARVVVAGAESRAMIQSLQVELPNLQAIVLDTTIVEASEASFRDPECRVDDPCLIIYSSGTTGWPKGIVHTQANLASALVALQSCWQFTPDDVVLNVLPLFHVHGLCFATQLTLLSGGCVILDDFEPQRTLKKLADCTVFMAVPTIYYRLLEGPEFKSAAPTWSKARLFTCGSAPIRAEVLPDLESILGRPVINRYGMTEAFVITSLPLAGPWPHGSVGLPLDGIDVRIVVEAESCRLVQPGEVGAVQLRGPSLFREYWKKPEATRDAIATGWFDTGDLGFRDDKGFLTLVGRKHDLIITSGFNVYPQVVERVINSCPGVRESAVLGIPDERKGERVAAVVVRDDPTLDEQRLRAFWGERLVDYQRPKDVIFADALPRNAMGKVLRRELRERIQQAR